MISLYNTPFFFIFRASFFFNISSKTSEVNRQSVLNLYIFRHFPKNLDRTITFNSVTLKKTQTEPQKYIIFFQLNKKYLESADKIKKIFFEIILVSTFRKITVGGFVNQLIKKFWPYNTDLYITWSCCGSPYFYKGITGK